MKILFSIITISYNDFDGLFDTLKSIAAQNVDNYELIVVDGGSKDGSAKILEDFDDLIDTWVSEPDGGIYDAMNKGVALARGEYINFMNSGDCFHGSTVLEQAGNIIRETGPDLFCGRAYARHSGNRYQYNDALWKGMICSHQATFSRRALNEKFPFSTEFKIAADYRFYVQCDTSGAPLQHVDLDVAVVDTEGVSFHSMEARTLERLRICHEFYRTPEVHAYFSKLAADNNFALPDWAASKRRWLRRAA